MVNKNDLMNQKFNDFSMEDKMKVLGITHETFADNKYKYYTEDMVVSDIWNGKTNSQKRKLMKAFQH